MLGQMLHGHQPIVRFLGQFEHGLVNPTFLVGHLYFMGQPAQMQPLTGNGRKRTSNRHLLALNRLWWVMSVPAFRQ
jgi:hypothetical protein